MSGALTVESVDDGLQRGALLVVETAGDVLLHRLLKGRACRSQSLSARDGHGQFDPGIPKVTEEPVVQRIATQLGVTPSQVGLAWLLQHSPNALLIPGTTSRDHLEANLAVGDIQLDEAMIAELDAIPAPEPPRQS